MAESGSSGRDAVTNRAVVRQHLENIDAVSRTWFELYLEGSALVRTLVVEVDFDTDHRRMKVARRRYRDYLPTTPGARPRHAVIVTSQSQEVKKPNGCPVTIGRPG